jgi:hypothetical protein
MSEMIRVADSRGRVTLPGFANAAVVIEAVGENEYRVRKAKVIPEDELRFPEEDMPVPLSERDARRLLDVLGAPPRPSQAARRAARRFRKKHG